MLKNIGGWYGQNRMWPVMWQDSKIDCIWKLNSWNNWFFACWYRFMKIKIWLKIYWVSIVKCGCCECGHGILKLTLSQKWTDRVNLFFACWYKFGKARSWFIGFWVGLVKNNGGLLVHETLNLLYLKNEFMNWADILNADSDAIVFDFWYPTILTFKCQGPLQLCFLFGLWSLTVHLRS